jgi:hypothetical protein
VATKFSVNTPEESAFPVEYAFPLTVTVTVAFGANKHVTWYARLPFDWRVSVALQLVLRLGTVVVEVGGG